MVIQTKGFVHAENEVSIEKYLLSTGMTEEEIAAMDPDFREYIALDLMENTSKNDRIEYLEVKEDSQSGIKSNQVLTGVSYSVSAYKSGSTIHIYPTYTFTSAKKPRGKDCFAYVLGDGVESYSYGGKLWWKETSNGTWVSDSNSSLTANQQGLNQAGYSGNQLGTPDYAIYFKGCTYCHANVGSGSDKRIVMSYMYNPNKASYTLGFNAGPIGISFSSPGTIYTSASTQYISW